MFELPRLRNSIAALCAVVLVAAAQPARSAVTPSEDEAKQTLERILVPAAATWSRDTANLDTAMNALCAVPQDKRAVALQNTRQAWITAMKDWRALGVLPLKRLFAGQFAYGVDWPTVNIGLLGRSVAFMVPDEKSGAPGTMQPRSIELSSVEVRGMSTLAYLLWPDASTPMPVPALSDARTCRYALLFTKHLRQQSEKLKANMALPDAFSSMGARRGASTEATTNEVLLNAMVDGLRQLRKRHAPMLPAINGRSVPVTADRITDIDGARMQESAVFYQVSVESLTVAALGKKLAANASIPGLVAVLQGAGHEDLIAPVQQGFAKLREDARRIPTRMEKGNEAQRETAKLLAEDAQHLINLLSGQVAIALGVVVGFGDGDGG